MKHVKHRRYTVGVLAILVRIDYDAPETLDRYIDYTGRGWYSMNEAGIYQRGKQATNSRIKVR